MARINWDRIHLGLSLSGKYVYIGKVKRSRNGISEFEDKVDRTSEFLGIMIKYLKENGGGVEIWENGKPKYIVKLEEIKEEEERDGRG